MTLAGACDDMWGGVTHGLEEGVMLARCLVAAVILITTCCSEALALWSTPEFGDVIDRADICVCARVTHAKELGETDSGCDRFNGLADFTVERVVFGASRKGASIQVYYGSCLIDSAAFSPGERYVLFLSKTKAPLSGWESPELHCGLFRVAREDTVTVHKHLRRPPKSRKLSEFLEEIFYVRGPEVIVRPAKKSLASDEPITLTVTLRNPSSLEMLVALPAKEDSPYGFRALFFTAGGMPLHSVCWPLIQEHRNSTPYLLMPGKSVTRAMTFEPPLHARAERSYRTLAKIALAYEPDNMGAVEGTWHGVAYSRLVPFKVVSRCPAIDGTLGDAGKKYAVWLGLSEPDVVRFASGEPVSVGATVAYLASPVDDRRMVRTGRIWSGYGCAELSDEELNAMAGQLEVRRDGKPVVNVGPAPKAAGWLQAVAGKETDPPREGWQRDGFELRLDRRFDLTRPGRYTVRLVVPPEETGEKRSLASNLIEFTVVGTSEK